MTELVSLNEFGDDPTPLDFRRANGAPMVRRIDDDTKWERYSRPSGWGGDLDDESALVNWRIDRAIEGVALDPSIAATVAANIGVKAGATERRERAIQRGRGDEAADMGTALHRMTERIERGDGFVAPPPYDADIAAYLACIDQAGLASEYIEVHLCADEWRAAGTADRIYRATRELAVPSGPPIEPGQLVLGDLKTGKLRDYSVPGYTIQTAIYVDSCFYDVATDQRTPLPDEMRTDWALLVHLPVGTATCSLLWVDLTVGRHGAELVRQVRQWRRRKDFVVDFKMPPSADAEILDDTALRIELDANVAPLDGAEWIAQMAPFALSRITVIGSVPAAREALLRLWPAGITRPHAEMESDDLTKILDLLDSVEAAFSLPFPVGDPRPGWTRGLHRSEAISTNTPPTTESEPS